MPRNAIVLVIDRLSASFLGPYGNTWVETPHFNRLAAASLLADFAVSDSVDLLRVYRSYWLGRHAADGCCGGRLLPELLHGCGPQTVLLTDEGLLAAADLSEAFADRIQLPETPAAGTAEDISQTHFAQLIATALEHLETLPEPFLLWIHARGLSGPWDAPWDCRNQYADAEDPPPPTFVAPPAEQWPDDVDPDHLLGLQHACGGQVSVVDACLGVLLDAVEQSSRAPRTLLAVTAPRGYPLGEHGYVGDGAPWLFNEHLQVPCLFRFPDRQRDRRLQASVQPPDLYATLAAWLAAAPADRSPWGRELADPAATVARPDVACSVQADAWTLRTPAWSLHTAGDLPPRLYAKPEDRWEVNDVAERCPEVVARLRDVHQQFAEAVAAGDPQRIPPLPELLSERLH